MSAKLDEKRLKLAAQGLRKTALSLQAAVVGLCQAAEALTAETDDNLVEHPLDVNLQDLLKGDIHGALGKFLSDAFNTESEALDEDQKTQNGKQTANGVKKPPRKPRPPRDPNAPTKPQNAFIFYQKDVASQVKAENPGKPWSEIVHLISTRWKALPKEEREIYDQKFEEAKQRYEVDFKAYIKRKDQEVEVDVDGADGHEDNNISDSATPNSASDTSHSDEENEEDEEDTLNLSNARSSRLRAKSAKTSQPDPESSSKKKSKKRKPLDNDDNESANEEEDYEESPKKSKKISNEEGGNVEKDRKKPKKSLREDEDLDLDGKSKKKKNNKKKKLD